MLKPTEFEQGTFDFVSNAPGIITPGTICVSRHGTIGWYQYAYLFWHVRFPEMKPDGTVHYLCHPLPYGPHPNSQWWFDAEELMPIGLSWPVPAWATIESWARNAHAADKTLYANTLVAGINKPHPTSSRWPWPTYAEEADLAAMLNGIYPDWPLVSHDNHHEAIQAVISNAQTNSSVR